DVHVAGVVAVRVVADDMLAGGVAGVAVHVHRAVVVCGGAAPGIGLDVDADAGEGVGLVEGGRSCGVDVDVHHAVVRGGGAVVTISVDAGGGDRAAAVGEHRHGAAAGHVRRAPERAAGVSRNAKAVAVIG